MPEIIFADYKGKEKCYLLTISTALSGQPASLEEIVDLHECQWHTPHTRQQGCTRKKNWKSEWKKSAWHRNGDHPLDSVHIHTSLPPQSPSGILPHALILAHLPLQQQLAADKDVLGRCSPGYNSVQRVKRRGEEAEEVIRHWSRTNMNSGSMSPNSEGTCCCPFFFFANSRIRLCLRAVEAARLMVATLYWEFNSNLSTMISNSDSKMINN